MTTASMMKTWIKEVRELMKMMKPLADANHSPSLVHSRTTRALTEFEGSVFSFVATIHPGASSDQIVNKSIQTHGNSKIQNQLHMIDSMQ
jgi:hypothetical protein